MTPRILIADDDEAIRDVFRLVLANSGYIIDLFDNGSDLLNNRFLIPDLFLIDKQLSDVCGLDVCRFLEMQQHTMNIPVVMISASPDIAQLAKDAGAESFIEKPFDMSLLLKVINAYTVSARNC